MSDDRPYAGGPFIPTTRHAKALTRIDELEAERDQIREALELAQRLVNLPAGAILNDTERVRRIKLVVDAALDQEES